MPCHAKLLPAVLVQCLCHGKPCTTTNALPCHMMPCKAMLGSTTSCHSMACSICLSLCILTHACRPVTPPFCSVLCSMVDIAQQAGLASPAAAEEAVLRMIDAGEVSARIR